MSSSRSSRSRRWDRSRSRSRSRSWTRSQSRSRSRSRSRERSRDRHRRTWRQHDNRDDDYYYDKKDDRSHQSSSEPGPVVMFRNLIQTITKEQLTKALGSTMSYIRDVRLIQNREGSKNYAFVEFFSTEDAIKWMDSNKNNFEVRGCQINLDYSRQRGMSDHRKKDRWSDWNCFKCGTLNFSKRSICLTCDCSRAESDSLHEDRRSGRIQDPEHNEDTSKSTPPSNVLIFRGLDGISTEESIRQAIAVVSNVYIKDIRLIKDKVTNTSRGFCFVETNTPEEAGELIKSIQDQYPAFFVDGKRVNASYARQNTGQSKPCTNAMAAAAIEQAQAMNQQRHFRQQQQQQAQLTAQYTAYQQQQSSADNNNTSTTTTNTGSDTTGQKQSDSQLAQNNDNLPSTYLFDATSGFYYDTTTGLYYDPTTQYHYNSQTGQYCYYDATKLAYIAVNSDGTPITESDASTNKEKKKKDIATISATKSAKKIAKDMERWAKSVNTQKQVQQQLIQQMVEQREKTEATIAMEEAIQTAVASETILDIPFGDKDSVDEEGQIGSLATALPNPVSVQEDTSTLGTDYLDWQQLVCLLCKRKFGSQEQLMKHQQFSDLHKQNLEKEKQKMGTSQSSIEIQYRDRAKERRDKYGTDAIVPGWKKRFERERAKEALDIATSEVLPSSNVGPSENIGSKLMKAMGWNEGEGLGKTNQGIIKPIEAEQRAPAAGLGAVGSSYGTHSTSGSYRDNVMSVARARFQQMFANDK